MLGSYHTNNKSVESQIMKRFLQQQSLKKLDPVIRDSLFIATLLASQDKMFETLYYQPFSNLQLSNVRYNHPVCLCKLAY